MNRGNSNEFGNTSENACTDDGIVMQLLSHSSAQEEELLKVPKEKMRKRIKG